MIKFIAGVGVGIVAGSIAMYLGLPASPPEVREPVGASEVSSLIARLNPIAKHPTEDWYLNGFTLTFRGDHFVEIELKMPNDEEYHAKAKNLKEAVDRLTAPSKDIQEALKGWSTP